MARVRIWLRRALRVVLALLVLGAAGAGVVWWKYLRLEEQAFADAPSRFKYGSLGAEGTVGIPYPIFMILPRIFPDLVEQYAKAGYGPDKQGWGGYSAFGLVWEQGQRLPVGLSIRRMGFERVTANCALCHTATYRMSAESDRVAVVGGPGHTVDIQALLRFLFAAAHDARFNSARILPEMLIHFPLDWIDRQVYAFILIPKLRLALLLAEKELGWMDHKTPWGPGRDDAFNLPKFILLQQPWDDSVGNTDFPGLWGVADHPGWLLHAGGEAKTVYAVTATSALGAGSLPVGDFRARNEWLVGFMRDLKVPPYPGAIDQARAARGKEIYAAACAACHAADGARTGTAIPLAEIGTDPEHVRAWTVADADRMNRFTSVLGASGAELQAAQGYVARKLSGVWLLGPYLHNGSVPTIADLLSPPAQRPRIFYRGYDVLDQERLGFVAEGKEAEAEGFRHDTGLRGNGNGGHVYGTELGEQDRAALIEFLKTL